METITRKFLVKDRPDVSKLPRTSYSRYYLFISSGLVIRVQDVGGEYELERKFDKSDLIRESQKMSITKEEFDELSKIAKKHILRDSYVISEKQPNIVLRIYHGEYEGFARSEVTFGSVEEAENFIPLSWFDKEITNSPLAKDGTLLNLSTEEFKSLIK